MNEKNTRNVIPNVDSKKKEERNVPDLRFKGFVNDWIISNIYNEFSFLNNNSFSRDNLNYNHGLKKNIHYGDILTKYETVKNPIDNDVPYINDNIKTSNGLTELISGDIILADTAEDYIVGKAIEIYNPNSLKLYSGLHTIALRPKSKFSIGYLAYYFNSYYHKKRMFPLIQGIKVYSISKTALSTLLIRFPDLEEQEKISRLLIKIDNRIFTQKKIISNLKSLINSIKNTEFYYIKGFKEKLENILIELNEKTIINNQYDVLSSTVKGIFKQSDYFDRTVASENTIGYKIVKRGNIVVSPQNLWMGNISYNDKFDMGIVSPSYKIFNISSNYNERYIFEMLTTKKSLYLFKTVSEQGASVVRRNLNYEAFMQLTFNVPSLNEQNNFIEKLSLLQSKLSLENKILSLLEQQKQYLLDKLFI